MKTTLLLCQLLLAGLGLYAQPNVLLSSSGSTSGPTLSASWVLGDIFITDAILKSQISKTDDDLGWMVNEVKLLNNPVGGVIRMESTLQEQLSYCLFNLQGQPVSKGIIEPGETSISTNNIPAQVYALILFAPDGRYLTAFKIIKIN